MKIISLEEFQKRENKVMVVDRYSVPVLLLHSVPYCRIRTLPIKPVKYAWKGLRSLPIPKSRS